MAEMVPTRRIWRFLFVLHFFVHFRIWLALISPQQRDTKAKKISSEEKILPELLNFNSWAWKKKIRGSLATWQKTRSWTSHPAAAYQAKERQLCLFTWLIQGGDEIFATDQLQQWLMMDWICLAWVSFSCFFSKEQKEHVIFSWIPSSAHTQTPKDLGWLGVA